MSQASGKLPLPKQGLVVTFNYLWSADGAKGDIEARKARPCIVVAVAVPPMALIATKVVGVVPITHSMPNNGVLALAVADWHKRAMGLDNAPCWVVCGEMNTSIWPGYDLLRTPKAADGWIRGRVPAVFLDQILSTIRNAVEASLFSNTPRR